MNSTFLKPAVERLLLFIALVCLTVTAARGDVLVGQDDIVYGKAVSISKDRVEFARGCNAAPKSYPWMAIQFLIRDAICEAHQYTPPAGGLHICSGAHLAVFKVYFSGQDDPVYATDLATDSAHKLHLTLAKGGSMQGPADRLELLFKDSACLSTIPEEPVVPSGFCYEPPAFAVNFRKAAITSNTILTAGFSVYVEAVGPSTGVTSEDDVARAFGTALNLWTSGLLAQQASLEPKLRAYIASVTRPGRSATLFVPPQVIRVVCPENATFIVRMHNAIIPEFKDPEVVALAQLEGRTILLNATGKKYSFAWDLRMHEAVKDRTVNLTTVLAHEFGHALGLGHVTGRELSIMNPENLAAAPTTKDIQRFIKILQQSITGSQPGVLFSKRCAGLRLTKPAGRQR